MPPADRLSILYNPSAGMGRALKKKIVLERLLRSAEVRYDLVMTRSGEHLRELTREHARTYPTLVGAGGDSTFHIIVDEIARTGENVAFGMIGVGSSNDIAREFGVGSLFDACRALKTGRVAELDLGCVLEGDRPLAYFLGQANIGLGAHVNRYVAGLARRRPWLAKRQALAGALGIRGAYAARGVPLRLELRSASGDREGQYVAAIFSNIKYWATGKLINPAARPDDGELDSCLIGRCSFLRLARISSLANTGRHGQTGEVEFLRAPSFVVRSETPFAVQSDGEIVTTPDGRTSFAEVTIRILPRALKVILP